MRVTINDEEDREIVTFVRAYIWLNTVPTTTYGDVYGWPSKDLAS